MPSRRKLQKIRDLAVALATCSREASIQHVQRSSFIRLRRRVVSPRGDAALISSGTDFAYITSMK